MSIEEKARAYDEALERAKELLLGNEHSNTIRSYFEHIFPELKESEDERIRKKIINFLRSPFVNENITDEKVAPWLSWLEKQKEHVPENEESGTRKEQKPTSFNEPYNSDDYEVVVEGNATSLKRKEQKPAWSEEDEDRIRQIERIAQQAGCTQKLQEEIHDWLKSLWPQPHWKPSEDQIQAITYLASSIPPNFLKEQEYTMRLVAEVIEQLKSYANEHHHRKD